MATLESIIGTPLDQLLEDKLIDFIEGNRQTRQQFLEGAYDTRKTKRTESQKRKARKEVSAELLAELDELELEL